MELPPPWNPPRGARGYKFFSSRWLDGIINGGRLRIGVPDDFRVQDQIDGGRNDRNEMLRQWEPEPGTYRVDKHHPFGRMFADQLGDKIINLCTEEGTILTVGAVCYMFCLSDRINRLMCRRMAEDFDCDMYLKIKNLAAFMQVLRDSDSRLSNGALFRIRYSDENKMSDKDPGVLDDVLWKDKSFLWQHEVRAIWTNETRPPRGFIVDAPDILQYITIHRNPAVA
jgi:hypothetical protein